MGTLLAVDLGLRTGLALFRAEGRLIWYRSQHFANRAALRRGVQGILNAQGDLDSLVLEGGGAIADVWIHAAELRGIPIRQISAEDWRADLFHPKDTQGRDRSKRSADALARRVIEWSRAPRATSLRHDAAEAIGIGFWAVLERGWLQQVPSEIVALTQKTWKGISWQARPDVRAHVPAALNSVVTEQPRCYGELPMKDDFASLFAYNRWANDRVLEACRKLTPEQYAAEPYPGWSSVRSTIVHIAIVAEGWLRGIGGVNVQTVLTEEEMPTVDDAARLLEQADAHVAAFLATVTPQQMEQPVTLRRGTRSATLPPWVVLRHVVNHSTYHRGQVASKLKRFGIEQPATDLIFWAFEHIPQTG